MNNEYKKIIDIKDQKEKEFLDIIKKNGFINEFEWYHAEEKNLVTEETIKAHDEYIKALHTFYNYKNGEKGFLGKYGI